MNRTFQADRSNNSGCTPWYDGKRSGGSWRMPLNDVNIGRLTSLRSPKLRNCESKNPLGRGRRMEYPKVIPPARSRPWTTMLARFRWLTALVLAVPVRAAEPVDYARDVKPILAAHCVSCHGPKQQKSELRLDLYARVKQGGNSGPAVVPNKSAESRLIQAVTGSNPDVAKMPPKGAVPPAEIAVLKRWIDEGARGPAMEDAVGGGAVASTHWSFQPVKRPPLPATKNPAWVRNGIDHFILARLEKDGIAPSPEADRVTLIRRLSLDLTGLPPTPAEVDAFLKDRSPKAPSGKLIGRSYRR